MSEKDGILDVSFKHEKMTSLPHQIINNRTLMEAYAMAIISKLRIAVLDSNCRIIWVNERFCGLTKYHQDELVGQRIQDLKLICDDMEKVNAALASLSNGLKWSGEVKSQAKDGLTFWVKTDILPIFGNNDELESYLVFCSDITAMKAALKEKDDVLERLTLGEARYRALVENQSDLVSLCDANGVRIYVNASYCKFVGKHYDELKGTNIKNYPMPGVPDDVTQKAFQLTPAQPEISGVLPLKDAGGRSFWISLRIKGIFDGDGNLYEILTIGRDVTSLKKAELEKSNYIKDLERIAHMTSHNVRGPIATMLGFLELMRMNAIESEQWHDVLNNLKKCINDLDFYTRELGSFIYQRQAS
ncbi:MAG TPA: PAS domain S-box protein [Cyclobacteriaceae bacterium]|nr:PAS domain S-box protein [Cyclobacteriaceae bacterium]